MTLKVRSVVLVLVLLLAGCSVTPGRLVQNIVRKTDKLSGYYAEVEAVVHSLEGEQRYQVRQWVQLPDRWRVEVDAVEERQVFICDGQQVWIYQPELGEYYHLTAGMSQEIPPPFLLLSYLEELQKVQQLTLDGREKQEGRTCYVLSYEESKRRENVRLWLEKKSLFPLIAETYQDGELLNRLTRQNLILNPEFEEGIFEFSAGEEKEVASHCLIKPLSLKDVISEWSLPVYAPSYVPEDASLFIISRNEGESCEQLIFIYDGTDGFTLIQQANTGFLPMKSPGMEEVSLGGIQGFYQKNHTGELHTLWWSNETSEFVLTGHIGLAEMVKVATSMESQ